MSETTWVLLGLLGFALVLQGAKAVSRRRATRPARILLRRMRKLRMHRMLTFLGARPDEYVKAVAAPVIERQLYRCTHCRTLDICDRCLGNGKRVRDMHFCPNYPSLIKHSISVYRWRSAQGRGHLQR
jgi:hypothetical protein